MNANIIKLMAAGAVNVVKLEGEDKYLLAIITKTTKIFVPMLTLASANWAYVEDDGSEESAKTFEIVDAVLKEIKDKRIYGGVYAYRPKSVDPGKVPEHTHTAVEILKGFVGGAATVIPKGFKKMLTDAGYTLVEKDLSGPVTVRDYSALLADPANKANFDTDAAELAKAGATFDGLLLEAKMAFEAIRSGKAGGVIFEGPTGTGKSWMARIMAHQFGAPLLNLQITNGTVPDDLIGTFSPATDADAKSNWVFNIGPLLKAYSEGYQLVVEEVNFGQAGVLAVLNQFTDGTPRIEVNGKTYYRHHNFVVYMTMNPGYDGTDPLNVALKNRFIKVNVPTLTKPEFCARAEKYSIALGHKLSTAFFEKVLEFAGTIEKIGNSAQFHENVKFSIRNVQSLCNAILATKCSYEQFAAAVSTSYLNDLSCDNDNSDKLEALKKSDEITKAIREMYNLYDFAETVEVEPADGIAEFFSEDGSMDPDKKTAALKGLRDRIRL